MKTLFVPTDLSEHSAVALRYALHLCKAVKAIKLIYYFYDHQPINAEIPVLYLDQLAEIDGEIKKQMTQDLDKYLSEASIPKKFMKTDVVVTSEMSGTAYSILQTARKHKADLIVMGTHGKTGFEKFIFGSVTSAVLETSDIPVLAVPMHYKFKTIEKITYASSLTHFKQEIDTILLFAGTLSAQVEIVYIDYGLVSERLIRHANRVLADLNKSNLTLTVIAADVGLSLNENLTVYIEKSKPEWLVMFPVKREWYDKLFLSSKSLDLAMKFKKPMLVIQKKGE